MAGTSEELVTAQRPRFQVEGQDRAELASDLLWLEIRHDEQGLATLEARFNAEGPADTDRGLRYFDGAILQLGKQIKVAAGDADNEAMLFTGAITALRGRFGGDRGPQIVVYAEDAAFLLRLGQHTRTYSSQTDQQIAEQVAGEHSLTPSGSVDGPTHTELWQVNQTDLAFLRERARAVDARIGVGDEEIAFTPRRGGDDEPIALTTERELLSFEAIADLAHQRTEVQVHGWSVADKAAIHEAATADVVTAESAGGTTGPSVLDDLGWPAVEHHHLEVPVTTDEARRLAETMMKRRARRFVTARGATAGTPTLRVGRSVDISDAGPFFSGRYTVVAVRHVFDAASGLRTTFTAERVDLGGGG